MNPYEPPKGDVNPPDCPPPTPVKTNYDNRQYVVWIGAMGCMIVIRALWRGWRSNEGVVGVLMVAFAMVMLLWQRLKRKP